ncbi:CDP-diacylglycerol--serine O-phosphatidyltransferase [Motilimonas pumila]|uniref:CDP-diacylglycerol--serine O-phosphatidyltransferase n=1 Tax=Motilimonas pumila TaxID=2303987 RepID=A0A418YFK5_9GAMM|nr:CDP-diacylglycerol--serine O-phosphatidyltransferase [Motilimonas pumila]RJG48128.1 CDP-diacylglycerol--serine O-phosphatidyltransferase [Motilimonas pumila]
MVDAINRSLSFLKQQPQLNVRSEDINFLYDAADFRCHIIQHIQQAEQRIYLTALYLENDEAGQEILAELHQAQRLRPELKIVILVDFHRAQRGLIGHDAGDTNADFYRQYCEDNQCHFDILGIPVKSRELFGVLHLKGFVFDDTVLYSGASLNNIYLNKKERYRYDRYCLIKHSGLAQSMVEYIDQLRLGDFGVVPLNQQQVPKIAEIKPEHKRLKRFLKRQQYQFSPQVRQHKDIGITPLLGFGGRGNLLNKTIRQLLQSCQHSAVLFTPYFNFPAAISRDISAMLKRGVKITLVVGDKTANDFYISPEQDFRTIGGLPYLYETNLRKFARRHHKSLLEGMLDIHIWKHDNNSFHLKGIYSDDKYMLLTGNNLNPRAWRLDLENGLLLHDETHQLAEMQQRELALILENCQKISSYQDIEDIKDYPERVQKLLSRMRVIRADNMVKRII